MDKLHVFHLNVSMKGKSQRTQYDLDIFLGVNSKGNISDKTLRDHVRGSCEVLRACLNDMQLYVFGYAFLSFQVFYCG